MSDQVIDRFRGCLLGLAAGDAVGTTVEFRPRGTFEPLTGMVGGGPFELEPGQWTDDTSMALCLAASLVESAGFDARDQMDRYVRWWREGYMSSNGRCFDIGNTVSSALRRYEDTGDPISGSTDRWSAGNGSIMRLAPVPMFYWPDRETAIYYSGESSRTTHGADEAVDACRYFGLLLHRALSGNSRADILGPVEESIAKAPAIVAIVEGDYKSLEIGEIKGSGYVVDCLRAALWCFFHTDSFESAILQAANLGNDADTTAAVCGQIAGAYYGESGIPEPWRLKLAQYDLIGDLADQLASIPGT